MKTFKKFILSLAVLASVAAAPAPLVLAATNCSGASENSTSCAGGPSGGSNSSTSSTQQISTSLKNNPIVKDLNVIVNFLSVGVGIIVIGSLITGGIQYSMSGGSPDGVNKAKTRITNSLLAFAVFLLIYGFLQWVVPGGVFNS